MYSEEDLEAAFFADEILNNKITFKEWLKKFKKEKWLQKVYSSNV